MRIAVPVAAAGVIVAAVGIAVAARGDDRSACGEVGDRERVSAPDGRRVAFVRCTAAGSTWLYVAEGDHERRVVPASYGCCYRPSASVVFRTPAWSPDGSRLAVVIADAGGTDVWTLDAGGRRARRVTEGPAVERAPRWSRDGRRIAFRTETGALASVTVAEPSEAP
jgi:Tol biopolymer transport system component